MKNLLLTILLVFSLSSCDTYNYVETDSIYDTEYVQTYATDGDINIIITNGTPYYYNGQLWYYYYRNLYYYPFWYDGYWYLRPYNTLYSWDWYRYHYYHFKPNQYDQYRFRPGYHGFYSPNHRYIERPHNGGRRPNINNGHIRSGRSIQSTRPRSIPRRNTGRRH